MLGNGYNYFPTFGGYFLFVYFLEISPPDLVTLGWLPIENDRPTKKAYKSLVMLYYQQILD